MRIREVQCRWSYHFSWRVGELASYLAGELVSWRVVICGLLRHDVPRNDKGLLYKGDCFVA